MNEDAVIREAVVAHLKSNEDIIKDAVAEQVIRIPLPPPSLSQKTWVEDPSK
jgi:hypothetical protein